MNKLTIFYDGACIVCAKEINHYKAKDDRNLLDLVDISSSEFDASKFNLDPVKLNVHMHTMDNENNVFIGVDSFLEIWKRLNGYRILVPFFGSKILRPSMNFGYNIFAKHIRPRLPKRKCADNTCQYLGE